MSHEIPLLAATLLVWGVTLSSVLQVRAGLEESKDALGTYDINNICSLSTTCR